MRRALASLLAGAGRAGCARRRRPAPAHADAGDDFTFGISDGSPIYPVRGLRRPPSSWRGSSAASAPRPAASRCAGTRCSRTEPPPVGPPLYDWSGADELVAALGEEGIEPLPMVLGSPAWARTEGCSGICPPAPEHLADFGLFVASVVARYRDAAAVEIWNEPNLALNWAGGDGPDPAAYAEMFEVGARGQRPARPRDAAARRRARVPARECPGGGLGAAARLARRASTPPPATEPQICRIPASASRSTPTRVSTSSPARPRTGASHRRWPRRERRSRPETRIRGASSG